MSGIHLTRRLGLLNHSYFVTILCHLVQVLVEDLFRKANMQFLRTTHPVKVKQLIANDCVAEENFVKLAQLEEENFKV